MAKRKKVEPERNALTNDFSKELIRALNRENGERVAYNLAVDDSPTHVKRWISTGSKTLDYICANRKDGGLPEGRIIEIFGPPSIGKSHIAAQIARSTQKMNGLVVYIDTENATMPENLGALGVDVANNFVYVQQNCTEHVLATAERTIVHAKALAKDVPVTIIWDSVAASSPKAELDGDYDQNSIGLQARAISKGMRKITGVIGDESVLFVCLNQVRVNIGQLYGDPDVAPGGKAIPFHSSIRIKLGAGKQIKDKNGDVVGIHVSAKTLKNKVAFPFRKVDFEIHFGIGIKEHEQMFDLLRVNSPYTVDGNNVEISGTGAWKTLRVTDPKGNQVLEKKFQKTGFEDIIPNPIYSKWIEGALDEAMVKKFGKDADPDIDHDSYTDIEALHDELAGE